MDCVVESKTTFYCHDMEDMLAFKENPSKFKPTIAEEQDWYFKREDSDWWGKLIYKVDKIIPPVV